MAKTNTFMLVFSVILLVLIAIGVFYVFGTHLVAINTCGGNKTLVVFNNKESCFPSLSNTIIANGTPYTLNSSLAVSNGRIIPLDIRFIGNNPLLYIWNQNKSYNASSYVFLTIPDTFKVHMQYASNVTTEYIIMTNEQYINWYNSNERSTSNVYSQSGTAISAWFNESAGCAGYVAVIKSVSGRAFFIRPNETALYAPANTSTGICT